MADKLYLNVNTAGEVRDGFNRVIDELKKTRRGHELFLWEAEVDDAVVGEEEEG